MEKEGVDMFSHKSIFACFVRPVSFIAVLFLTLASSGCDQAVTQLDNQEHVSMALNTEAGESDVDGYDYCGDVETCSGPVERGGELWCQNKKACTDIKGCACNLFQAEKGESPRKWKYKEGPNKKIDPDHKKYAYACWCTRKH